MTATMAMAPPSVTSPEPRACCCPNCGYGFAVAEDAQAALLEAQKQIAELEAQVRLLNDKATAAVDRLADYEDEISRLRSSQIQSPTTTIPSQAVSSPRDPSPSRASFLSSNRLSTLLSPRQSTPNLRSPPPGVNTADMGYGGPNGPLSPTPSTATTEDLIEALGREQNLRKAAESRLSTTSREVEELSVALFEQANDMVATERKARAKLAERVEVLEKRDVDKRRRLERLEHAMNRIERVRAILNPVAADTKPETTAVVERVATEELAVAS